MNVLPGRRGIRVRLHDLEADIMDVVWSTSLQKFAVADVLEVLQRRRVIAYTTVMTTVARLYDKGVLTRQRDGKRYLYAPRFTREEFLETTARDVLKGLGAQRPALALLADTVSRADEATLDELEQLIERRRKAMSR